MDPTATPPEPVPALPGFPFLPPATCAILVGPTGSGRSSAVEACAYDAAKAGLRIAYGGSEVTQYEFDARAAHLAHVRGDEIDDDLRAALARVRYLDIAGVIARAWDEPAAFVEGISSSYDVVILDPLSAVESATGLNFEQRNSDFVRFYDVLVQPCIKRGVSFVLPDNVGHAIEARNRAKGASAKQDRADLTLSCRPVPNGLAIRVGKVRSIRSGLRHGDEWVFIRDTQTIERSASEPTAADDDFKPTVLMARVSKFVEANPGASQNAVKAGVKGRDKYVERSLRLLVEEGYVDRRTKGQTSRHYSIRPFQDIADEPRPNAMAPVPADIPEPSNATEASETPLFTEDGTGAKPRPNRGPAPDMDNRGPKAQVRSTGPLASVSEQEDLLDWAEQLEARHRGVAA